MGILNQSLSIAIGCFLWLGFAYAATYELAAGSDVVGDIAYVQARPDDTFSDIARRYNLGFEEIESANPGIDAWLPVRDRLLVVPTQFVLPKTPRVGIVLNLAELRLYYYPPKIANQPVTVMTFPVSIGRMNWSTPLVLTTVTGKVENPSWRPPQSIRAERSELPEVVPPGPDNPLGQFALRLGIPGYLIHGTNRSFGIGMRITHGCIRLYPEDIQTLFDAVAVGTPVHIVDQPYKAGWLNRELYLEAHTLSEGSVAPDALSVVRSAMTLASHANRHVHWEKAATTAAQALGVPIRISR